MRGTATSTIAALCAASSQAWAIGAPAPSTPKPPDCRPWTLSGAPTTVVEPSDLPVARPLNPAAPYGGVPADVLTFHYDNNRTGWNPKETDLTPAAITARGLGLIATLNVDGAVIAQPLLVSGYGMPDGSTHDVLVVATANDSVYAYDAQTDLPLWRVNLGPAQNAVDVGVGVPGSLYGITSTPVIVRSGPNSATLYLVAATETATPTKSFHSFLHALDLGTGHDTLAPTEIAVTGTTTHGVTLKFDPLKQQNRAGLAYNNGSIYVGIGSHSNDAGIRQDTGWLLRYDTTLTLRNAFATIANWNKTLDLASIWMSGFAPAVDADGNVFVTTGNGGNAPSIGDYGMSMLKLSPTLDAPPLGVFTPPNAPMLNTVDADLSSGGVMLMPPLPGQSSPALAVGMGKDPVIYLVDQAFGPTPLVGSYRISPTVGQGVWGGPAYFNSPSGPLIYYQTTRDLLRSFSVSAGVLMPVATSAAVGGLDGSEPVVTSNGSVAGTGLVWVIHRKATEFLEVYDALKLGAPILTFNTGVVWTPFATPMVVNGRAYVGGLGVVSVFGLTK